MKSDYSEKEFQMVSILSPLWAGLIEENKDSSIVPPTVLRMIAEECFVYNKQGPAVESLRRCMLAIRNSSIYRNTKEYDDLIQL